ncbi:TetR/AcrR family transcriptional regulator [Vagococcus sp.]|uniref:TetR/AcrR family transcriptional regulator n=1 Tax=Vagococcus sp. TaxID=1933889 RepID=UPI002FCAC432
MKKQAMDNYLWQHFFELMVLDKKVFSDIRVREICDKATIHRSTFYRHFEDKYQLLEFGLFTLWNDYFELDEREKFYTPFSTANEFYEKSTAEALIRRNEVDEEFIKTADAFFLKQLSASFSTVLKKDSQKGLPNDLLTRFVASSIQAIGEWAQDQPEKISHDKMDTLYKKLVLESLDLSSQK